MTDSQTCPDRKTLEKMLLGKLPQAAIETIGEHLGTCETCSNSAATIEVRDDLTDAILARRELSGDEALIDQAIARSKLLGSRLYTIQSVETLPVTGFKSSSESVVDSFATSQLNELDFLSPAQLPDELGRIGEYRVLQLLGIGGMGMVFRAEDPRLKRQIALKVMKPSVSSSQSAKQRFIREAQFNAAIEHDHIVHIYQVSEDRGVPFIAMQYLRGESLKTLIDREHKLKQTEVVRIGKEVAAGLAAAHEHGLIHRDIKPDNIWIEEKTHRAKILDFGLVRATAEDFGLTMAGMVLGTPQYMAPEQALGQPVDHRCDLFSLGSMLYQLATGTQAFEGANLTATLMAVVHQDPVPLESLATNLHPTLSALITRLLSKERNDRPQTASEVSQALAALEQQLKLAATVEQISVAQLSAIAPKPATSAPPINKPPRRRFSMLAASAGAVFLILATIIITITNRDGTQTKIRLPEGVDTDVQAAPGSTVTITQEEDPSASMKVSTAAGGHGWPADAPAPANAAFAPVVPTTSVSPDRRVAEWVLRNGGAVQVWHAGETRQVDQPGQLPKDPISIVQLELPESFAGDFQILENVSLAKLSVLFCPSVPITDDMLRQIKDCRQIRSFQLDRSRVTDQGIEFLVTNWPNAEQIYISETAVGDDGIRKLANLKRPTLIVLANSKFTDVGLRDFLSRVNPSSLLILDISDGGTRFTDRSLGGITRLQSLQELVVVNTAITDESLSRFAELKSLWLLILAGTAITDDGLAQLPQTLRSMDVHSTNITDDALPHLLRLPKLTAINVRDTLVTQAGLEKWHKALQHCRIEWDGWAFDPSAKVERDQARRLLELGASIDVVLGNETRRVDRLDDLPDDDFYVSGIFGGLRGNLNGAIFDWNQLPHLKHVQLAQSGVTDADLRLLGECSELVELDFGECPAITDQGVAHLKQLKNLEHLELLDAQVTDRGLEELRGLLALRILNLDGTNITNTGMPTIATLHELRRLWVSRTRITDTGLAELITLEHLDTLGLHATETSDRTIDDILKFRDLTVVHLGSRVTNEGVMKLLAAPHIRKTLTRIIVNGNHQITDEICTSIVKCQSIAGLWLEETQIGDIGLEQLSSVSTLDEIWLTGSEVTAAGVEAFRKARPKCGVLWEAK